MADRRETADRDRELVKMADKQRMIRLNLSMTNVQRNLDESDLERQRVMGEMADKEKKIRELDLGLRREMGDKQIQIRELDLQLRREMADKQRRIHEIDFEIKKHKWVLRVLKSQLEGLESLMIDREKGREKELKFQRDFAEKPNKPTFFDSEDEYVEVFPGMKYHGPTLRKVMKETYEIGAHYAQQNRAMLLQQMQTGETPQWPTQGETPQWPPQMNTQPLPQGIFHLETPPWASFTWRNVFESFEQRILKENPSGIIDCSWKANPIMDMIDSPPPPRDPSKPRLK